MPGYSKNWILTGDTQPQQSRFKDPSEKAVSARGWLEGSVEILKQHELLVSWVEFHGRRFGDGLVRGRWCGRMR
jgi:hypothetical protein